MANELEKMYNAKVEHPSDTEEGLVESMTAFQSSRFYRILEDYFIAGIEAVFSRVDEGRRSLSDVRSELAGYLTSSHKRVRGRLTF